jgi:hypothetical protein
MASRTAQAFLVVNIAHQIFCRYFVLRNQLRMAIEARILCLAMRNRSAAKHSASRENKNGRAPQCPLTGLEQRLKSAHGRLARATAQLRLALVAHFAR